MRYDREGDQHYDLLSALQKSIRGSDPDAAVYYLGRLLAAGDGHNGLEEGGHVGLQQGVVGHGGLFG